MTEHKNIYAALIAAQQEFGQVKKGSVNPAFKSKYADLADVAGVVIPTLSQHGVAVLHYMTGDNLSVMRTEFVHAASETKVSCDVPLIVDRQNMQGMKSATTYAKRIGLESLSGIAPEDDDGNAAVSAGRPQPAATISDQQAQEIADLAEEVGADVPAFLKYLGVRTIMDLPAHKFGTAKLALERKRQKGGAA
jgi:2-methylisocitrate lyase-like PEP mutase family enzyme